MMSKDRVRFTLDDNPKQEAENVRAAVRAFGITHAQATGIFRRAGEIICRPSQFGRFIIFRVEEGVACNRIVTLKASLFTPEACDLPLDVSLNAAER